MMEISSNPAGNISVTENINELLTEKPVIYSQSVAKIFKSFGGRLSDHL